MGKQFNIKWMNNKNTTLSCRSFKMIYSSYCETRAKIGPKKTIIIPTNFSLFIEISKLI